MVRPFRYTTTRTILSFPHESYRPRGIGIGTLAAVHVSNLKVRGTLARIDLPTTSSRTGSFLPGSTAEQNEPWPKRNVNGRVSRKKQKWGQMEQPSGERSHVQSTRRWPRHRVDLPVRIIALNGIRTTPIDGRGSAISRAGMALHARVALNPGDLMQLQFPTPTPSQVRAVVRNRNGECLGLEFLTQLPPDSEAIIRSRLLPGAVPVGSPELRKSVRDSCNPQSLYAGLRRKREELRQVQREIEALHVAILLLTDDEEELSGLSAPCALNPGTRQWPLRS